MSSSCLGRGRLVLYGDVLSFRSAATELYLQFRVLRCVMTHVSAEQIEHCGLSLPYVPVCPVSVTVFCDCPAAT